MQSKFQVQRVGLSVTEHHALWLLILLGIKHTSLIAGFNAGCVSCFFRSSASSHKDAITTSQACVRQLSYYGDQRGKVGHQYPTTAPKDPRFRQGRNEADEPGPYFTAFPSLQSALRDSTPIYTKSRACTVLPNYVGLKFMVHNGKDYLPVQVTEEMVGHKLGEFSVTRKKFSYR